MQAITEQRGTLRCLRLAGELNIYAGADLKAALVDALAATTELEIDLAEVTEIDSSGIQLLAAAKREAMDTGKAMRLVNHSSAALELMDLYDLASCFGDPLVLPQRHGAGASA